MPTGIRISVHMVSDFAAAPAGCAANSAASPSAVPSTSGIVARSPPIRLREIWTGAPKPGALSHGEPVCVAW